MFGSSARRINIVDQEYPPARNLAARRFADGKSPVQVSLSVAQSQSAHRRRIADPVQEIALTGNSQPQAEISAEKSRLIIAAFPLLRSIHGNRNYYIKFKPLSQDFIANNLR